MMTQQLDLIPARRTRVVRTDAQIDMLAEYLLEWVERGERLWDDDKMAAIINRQIDIGHPDALPFKVTRSHVIKARVIHALHPTMRYQVSAEDQAALDRHLCAAPAPPPAPAPVETPIQSVLLDMIHQYEALGRGLAQLRERARM